VIEEYVNMGGGEFVVAGQDWNTSAESVIALDPDIVILHTNANLDKPFEAIEAFSELKAVKEGKVYASETLPWTSNTGGLFMSDTALQVARYIHPEISF
jgi:ABC-type Fe3+-hydroxamate transport system substrate-binding protein